MGFFLSFLNNKNMYIIIIINSFHTGIDPDGNDTHKLYLTKLCQDVETKLSAMIYDAIQSRDQSTMDDPLTEEIIQHTIFCQEKCRAFQGRHDTLKVCV